MRVKIFDVERGGLVLREECELGECFPSDPDSLWHALLDIALDGKAVIGGGAAPLVVLEPVGG